MRTPNEQLGVALSMFYEGFSLTEISLKLGRTFNNPVNPSSVHRWVIKYTNQAAEIFSMQQIQASNIWLMLMTPLKISGACVWVWDVLDFESRFLLASHLDISCSIAAVKTVIENACGKSQIAPRSILYARSVARPKNVSLCLPSNLGRIQIQGLNANAMTGFLGEFHTYFNQRTTAIQGLKSLAMAALVLKGSSIHYNFFRPSETLNTRTPAARAGLKTECKDWLNLVTNSGRAVNKRITRAHPRYYGR